ncbi:MAG: hypothetical protein ACSLFK_08840 [Gemmatimonadaceae bacterium]
MSRFSMVSAVLVALVAAGCTSDQMPTAPNAATPRAGVQLSGFAAPSGTVTIAQGDVEATVWPYTSNGFGTSPQDPINLIFLGTADPREIRATLLGLSGSGRPGPLAGFTCTWSDAVGDQQTSYSAHQGWVGSAIQLQCGNFEGPRFHVRLFRQGNVTLAGAHYEILIPGTNLHEPLSWELAEALVAADIARSGFLGSAPSLTGVITSAPYFRAVQAAVTAMLPAPQIAALGLFVNGDGTASIPNDGRATILNMASAAPVSSGLVTSHFVVQFGQVIPKPFCLAGTTGYLYASGPIDVHMRSGIVGQNFHASIAAGGTLTLIEFNPSTGQTVGAPYQGLIDERTSVNLTDGSSSVEYFSSRQETPDAGTTRGSRTETLRARQSGSDVYQLDISC